MKLKLIQFKMNSNFIHKDEIVNGLQDACEQCLLSSAQIRKFIISSMPSPSSNLKPNEQLGTSNSSPRISNFGLNKSISSSPSIKPHEKIRIDVHEQKLERFILPKRDTTSFSIDQQSPNPDTSLTNIDCMTNRDRTPSPIPVLSKVRSPDLEFDEDFTCSLDEFESKKYYKDHLIQIDQDGVFESSISQKEQINEDLFDHNDEYVIVYFNLLHNNLALTIIIIIS